jgi:hypothetical protein
MEWTSSTLEEMNARSMDFLHCAPPYPILSEAPALIRSSNIKEEIPLASSQDILMLYNDAIIQEEAMDWSIEAQWIIKIAGMLKFTPEMVQSTIMNFHWLLKLMLPTLHQRISHTRVAVFLFSLLFLSQDKYKDQRRIITVTEMYNLSKVDSFHLSHVLLAVKQILKIIPQEELNLVITPLSIYNSLKASLCTNFSPSTGQYLNATCDSAVDQLNYLLVQGIYNGKGALGSISPLAMASAVMYRVLEPTQLQYFVACISKISPGTILHASLYLP